MPIPQSIDDLDSNPNNNSPQGSETVGPNANGYLQAFGAFIKQLATGGGVKPTQTVDYNGQKLTNIADGDTSSSSKDAITGAQARGLAYKVGEQRFWHGAVADIATVWGTGWQLADGTNGTADLRNRFIVGAGDQYAVGATGGANTVTLTADQMPVHAHGVNQSPHGHGVSDGTHSHPVIDNQHAHPYTVNAGSGNQPGYQFSQSGPVSTSTGLSGSNINIAASGSNIGIQAANANISIQNAGSGVGHENRPPYYASCILEYTGIGA